MTESTMQNSHQVRSAVALSCLPAVLPILVMHPCCLTYLVRPLTCLPHLTLIRPPCILTTSHILCISLIRPPRLAVSPTSYTQCCLTRLLCLAHPPFTLYSHRLVSPPHFATSPTSCTCHLVRPHAAASSSLSSLSSIFVLYSVRMVLVGWYFFCTGCNGCITYATNELSSSAKM